MITESSMYWLTRLDGIHNFACLASLLLAIATIMTICWSLTELYDALHYNYHNKQSQVISFFVAFATATMFILFTGVALFVPTTKDMAAIKVIPRIANSQTIRDLGDGVAELSRQWIDELKPSKVGK